MARGAVRGCEQEGNAGYGDPDPMFDPPELPRGRRRYDRGEPVYCPCGGENRGGVVTALYDCLKNGVAPEPAIAKAFKRAEEIFAKYPIQQA